MGMIFGYARLPENRTAREDLREFAYHEAGHAARMVAYRWPIDCIGLNAEADEIESGDEDRDTTTGVVSDRKRLAMVYQRQHSVEVSLAGPLANMRYLREHCPDVWPPIAPNEGESTT